MTLSDYLIQNWPLATLCAISGVLFLLWTPLMRRFASAAGLDTLGATRLINAGSLIIIDVRDELSFSMGHINKALNIPLDQLEGRLAELEKKSAKNILVYCERGHRSARAAKLLKKTGKTIYNLAGGVMEWRKANLPLETSAEPRQQNPKTKPPADAKKSQKQ
jgi:rhodanese-related sulfurtransferase